MTPIERFNQNVIRNKESGCDIWQRATDAKGYPIFYADGVCHRAARWLYTRLRGEIPPGLEMSHICHNRACVRIHPDHVVAETHKENMERARKAGAFEGAKNGKAILSMKDVVLIRRLYEEPYLFSPKLLSEMYDVSLRTIYNVINYETYFFIIPDLYEELVFN